MVDTQDQGPYYQINDTKNSDLLRERQSASFDVEQLTQFMFGGSKNFFNVNKRRQISTLKYFTFIFLILQKDNSLSFLFIQPV